MTPRRAHVRPPVCREGYDGAFRLDTLLSPSPGLGRGDIAIILGAPGCGKTTALEHLAAVLPPEVCPPLLDDPSIGEVLRAAAAGPVIYAAARKLEVDHAAVFALLPWGPDELIEYLFSAHRARCAAALPRVLSMPSREELAGVPALWAPVLEAIVADETLTDARSALTRVVAPHLPQGAELDPLEDRWLAWVSGPRDARTEARFLETLADLGENAKRLMRHAPVRHLLATRSAVRRLRRGRGLSFLASDLPAEVVDACAEAAKAEEGVQSRLLKVLGGRRRMQHRMAATMVYAADPDWRPNEQRTPLLHRASLAGARWGGLRTRRLEALGADLAGADLRGAMIDVAHLSDSSLAGADLSGASLGQSWLRRADLSHAKLVGATLPSADLERATLDSADARGVAMVSARLTGCSLRGANLTNAGLAGAFISRANLEHADLSGAVLDRAELRHLRLDAAELDRATFREARFINCLLEWVELEAPDFSRARFLRTDFTGSVMPRAEFLGARFRSCGLADVQWEGANLRDADLRGVAFHMGSSRSGLVGSTIASEGSRTGFYTDEFTEQDFKAPEEIRKANLRDADLRGADVEGADFYLVDLRGAIYDADQAAWFRKCGAILHSRA